MDVTLKDVEEAIEEGYNHLEVFKRYTTCFMGTCQGKQCGLASILLFCKYANKDLKSVSVTTMRPPVFPVPLAVLAAQEPPTPIQNSSKVD